MARQLIKMVANGDAGMVESFNPGGSGIYQLERVTLKLSAVPVDSENFTVKLSIHEGNQYTVLLLAEDLQADGVTDLVFIPEGDVVIGLGDAIVCEYPNTNTNHWGLSVTFSPYPERVGRR